MSPIFGNLFRKKSRLRDFLKVDIHSHLIPSIDDGVKTIEESISIINELNKLGVEKIITTPHIMHGYYENSKDNILPRLTELQETLDKRQIKIKIEAAAEYFLDEHFLETLDKENDLLTIDNKYLLFETAFLNKPLFLEDTIFKIKSNGLIPLLAHPERYEYLIAEPLLAKKLHELGCKFQINLRSFSKENSAKSKDFIKWVFAEGLVDFVGSDVHNNRQLAEVIKVMESPLFDEQMLKQVKNNILT